ncbi:DNA-3-methyladenine glycosylase family protein [Aureispira anguillae]|uniref:DNA-3-methyladenine glycosylase II n=1 Tax=Aureispira anguillae TaxID=2864201 RepID=A0A915YKE3_9BACT|nr:DNA-3-methyladenine glycosylase 2 family protein [Aureispira anguillae]BDS14834.1 DNA-3-methyladenine glycosylase 2 family protein [Aureispira anguillae]
MHSKAIQVLSKDPSLKAIISKIQLPELSSSKDVYRSLLRSIVSQQLSVKAAATIHQRFLDLFDHQDPLPHLLLEKSLEELRAAGLSRQKAGYMQNIAAFALEHQFDQINWDDYTDKELVTFLTQIKGVGTWTVQMMLMFTLQRSDVFPSADLGIQQAMQKLYNIEGKGKVLISQMDKIAANWSPYRTIACRYLWQWKDL